MKLKELLMIGARARRRKHNDIPCPSAEHDSTTTYRPAGRRRDGMTFVGIPHKIAKRMGR